MEWGYTVKIGPDVVSKKDMLGVPDEEVLKKHMERAVKQGANPEIVKLMEGGLQL